MRKQIDNKMQKTLSFYLFFHWFLYDFVILGVKYSISESCTHLVLSYTETGAIKCPSLAHASVFHKRT